jgi:exodeoxyribonuclease VII small subunit
MAKSQQFEQQLAELEALVEQMESGEISLEQSLASFEKGIKLARACQKSLQDAELKVKTLLANNELIESDQQLTADE